MTNTPATIGRPFVAPIHATWLSISVTTSAVASVNFNIANVAETVGQFSKAATDIRNLLKEHDLRPKIVKMI